MPPGNRKSAVHSAATAPLVVWEQEQAANMAIEIKRIETIIDEPDRTKITDAIRRDLQEIDSRNLRKKVKNREKFRYWARKRVIRLSEETKKQGFVTMGRMEIKKTGSARELKNREGVFETRFTDLGK